MTASRARRRRGTQIGGVLVVLAAGWGGVLLAVAGVTLRNSEEGTVVAVDTRQTVRFPRTPALAIGVVGGEGRLASVAIAVLDPSGRGGSIVTVPTNVDVTGGAGTERQPLARRSFAVGDDESVAALVTELAPLLSLQLDDAILVDADGLAELLGSGREYDVTLDDDVVDAARDGVPVIAEAGSARLGAADLAEIAAAVELVADDRVAYDDHVVDVAVWSAVAESSGVGSDGTPVPLDDAGDPVRPADPSEFVERLRSGSVGARDLAIDPIAGITLDNPTGADFVVVDHADVLLVFASIVPELVLAPNEAASYRIVAPFSSEQLGTLGDDVVAEAVVRDLVRDIDFLSGNVVAVEITDDGADAATVLDVADERVLDGVGDLELFGPIESRLATRVLDGVDITVTLGTDFLAHVADLRAEEAARLGSGDGGSEFDVSGESDPDAEPAAGEPGDSTVEPVVEDDTVDDDE